MDAVREIVVGVDFSASSRIALAQALRLGGIWKARVHAVHVIDTLVVTELEEALAPIQREIRAGLVADAKSAWTDFAKGTKGASSLEIEVAVNNRAEAILDAARKHRADLVVVGAFSDVDPDLGVGTVASGCVRRSVADVLLARDDHDGPYRRVVVGIDFSETSRQALGRAVQIAAADRAELHILHVFAAPWRAVHWRSPNPATSPGFEKQYRDGLDGRLREFAKVELEAAGLKDSKCVLFDHDGHRSGIVDYGRKVHADLVVLGTRGRSNLRDLLLGSTAEKTLRDCVTSVLAVRPR